MNDDVLLHMCAYMDNRQKINFLSINIMTHRLKAKTLFKKRVTLNNISGLFYFDRFENICVRNRFGRLPENTKIVQFDNDFDDFIYDLKYPKKVTHMIFGRNFNKPIVGCIPPVQYLSFGVKFNQSIVNA